MQFYLPTLTIYGKIFHMKKKTKINKITKSDEPTEQLSLLDKLRPKLHIATYSKDASPVAMEFDLGIELNHVCISEYLDPDKISQTIKLIEEDLKNAGQPFPYEEGARIILHGPFTEIIPGSIDHRAVELGLERLEEAYGLCRVIGLNSMVVHSGYFPPMYYKDWHQEKSLIFWDRFLKGKDDFTVFVENSFEDEPYMMARLADEFDRPNLKLCFDIGHAHVATTEDLPVEEWIRYLGSRVAHYHLHNNMGTKDTHSPLGEGTMDMKKILTAIDTYNKSDYTMTLESQDCRLCVEWLKNNTL